MNFGKSKDVDENENTAISGRESIKSKNILSAEVADDQMSIFLDFYDLDPLDTSDKEKKEVIENSIDHLKRAIRRGQLEIKLNENNIIEISQRLKFNKQEIITYKVCGGEAKMAMAKVKKDDDHGRMYALLGSLSGIGVTGIAKLTGIDNSNSECLGALFLLV